MAERPRSRASQRQSAIVSVILLCAMAGCHPRPPAASSAPTSRPVSLVASIGERLAVLASADGKAAYLPGQFPGINSLVVTADGRSIMVGPSDCTEDWIGRIDISTGKREEFVGGALFPVVSAKGLAAYAVNCDGRGILGMTDIVTEQNSRRLPLGESEIGRSLYIESVRPFGWLSDNQTLFYAITVRGEAHPRYYFGRLWPSVTTAEEVFRRVASTVQESGSDPTAAALVDDATIAFAQDDTKGSRVREWDVENERFTHAERSFTLPETITALATDRSGMHFLAVTRGQVLYRWSVGDSAATKLAAGVNAAAWLPGGR